MQEIQDSIRSFGAWRSHLKRATEVMNTEHTWLDLVPPRGATPTELGPDSGPGDAISVMPDESRQLNRLVGMTSLSPRQADDYRQQVCRTLGPQRVAVILQNYERGQSTPVNVAP